MLVKRNKVNRDIFRLRDKSLEGSEDLPEPDVLAQEIADDLQTALDQFQAIAGELGERLRYQRSGGTRMCDKEVGDSLPR